MVVPVIEDIANVTAMIYEAAYSGRQWHETVEAIRLLLGGSRVCIARFDDESVDAICTVNDPDSLSQESARAFLSDPLGPAMLNAPVGRVVRPMDMIDRQTFLRGELWQDWFRPRDMYEGLTCNLLVSGEMRWMVDVQRGQKQPRFDAAEIQLMQTLAPHLQRAGEIERRFGRGGVPGSFFLNSPVALLLVDGEGRVIKVNEVAEALLAKAGSPLDIKAGWLHVTDPDEQEDLLHLVSHACPTRDGVLHGTGGALSLTGGEGAKRRRLALSVAPFVDTGLYGISGPRHALIIAREIAPNLPDGFENHIRAVFKLTASEASLATALASGLSLKESAASAGIQFGTVRGYLIRVFRKTGTSQQSQLVALLKSMQPPPPRIGS